VTTAATTSLDEPQIIAGSTAARVAHNVFGGVVPLLLTAIGYWSVRNANVDHAGGLGLIQVLPTVFFGVTFALALSFVSYLRAQRTHTVVLILHVVALIFLFDGVVSWIEEAPRFPVTYVHIGFIEYIQRTNHTLPSLDARMSWPAFFAMGAMLDKVAGIGNAYSMTLWAPLLFNLIYAPLVFSLARTITSDQRVVWLSTWLYFSISWVGQDYYSPQAVNFILFLSFMTILLTFFRSDRAAFPRGLRGLSSRISSLVQWVLRVPSLRPGGNGIFPTTTSQRAVLVVALFVLFAASVVSHQLTPFFMLFEVTALVIMRRTALRGFPLLMFVVVFGYISYGAIGFWSGHLSDMFGGLGQVSSVASQNVGAKVQQGHSNHVIVIYGRLALTAALWIVAITGLLRRLRRGLTDIFVMVGFLAPFLVLGGQSYGGEAILRVFLFSLPFAAVLAVLALLPTDAVKFNRTRAVVVVLVAALLAPVFMLARFGNEQFEYVSKDEYAGAQKLYQIAPVGSELVGIDQNIAWGIAGSGQYDFSIASNLEPFNDPNRIYQSVASHGTVSTYLYISRTQLENIAVTDGRPADWGVAFEQQLEASGRFLLVYQNPDVAIFRVASPQKAA
jgi:hypothetical protein